MQVTISQGMNAGPRSSNSSSPYGMMDGITLSTKMCGLCVWYWQPENITQAFMSRVFIGASRLTAQVATASSLQPL